MRIILVLVAILSFGMKAKSQSGNLFTDYMEAWNLFVDGDDNNDPKKFVQSFEKMKVLAQKGFPPAQYELARDYEHGTGCSVDFTEAFKWMKACVDNREWDKNTIGSLGNNSSLHAFSRGSAYLQLGMYYMYGYGGVKDMEQAVLCWQKGKEYPGPVQGTCYLHLGMGYNNGIGGLPKDYKKAVEMYKKATDLDDPDAPLKLAIYYANGKDGIPKSDTDAFFYTNLAAKRGNVLAMRNMGQIYDYGWFGQQRDEFKAVIWYIKAAKRNNSEAIIRLSELGINDWNL